MHTVHLLLFKGRTGHCRLLEAWQIQSSPWLSFLLIAGKDNTKFPAEGVKVPKLLRAVPALLLPFPTKRYCGKLCGMHQTLPAPILPWGKLFPLVPLLESHRCQPAFSETERVLNDFAFLAHGKALHCISLAETTAAPPKVPCSQSCFRAVQLGTLIPGRLVCIPGTGSF